MNQEQMHDHIEHLLGDLRHQIVDLRNNAAHVGGANDLQFLDIEN